MVERKRKRKVELPRMWRDTLRSQAAISLLPAHVALEMIKELIDNPTKASTGQLSAAGDARH
jgi:hypothetical protein